MSNFTGDQHDGSCGRRTGLLGPFRSFSKMAASLSVVDPLHTKRADLSVKEENNKRFVIDVIYCEMGEGGS